MKRFDIPIILLAAGQSSRMRGTDKLLEPVAGVPLIRVMAERARAATQASVVLALPPKPHPRYAALEGVDVQSVAVARAKDGMGASLATAITQVPAGSEAVMVVLADMPDVSTQDLCALAAQIDLQSDTRVWRAATAKGLPGHPVVFHRALFAKLARLDGDRGGQDILRDHMDQVQLVPLSGDQARLDLDTPEDWAAWHASKPVAPHG